MMRHRRMGWLGMVMAAGLVLSGGCIRNKVVVRVNPDGSGDILVTRVLSREIVGLVEKQMNEMRAHMGGAGPELAEDPFFDEKALKEEAASYGENVVFVAARKIDRGGARGALVHYQFKDIRDVRLGVEEIYGQGAMQSVMATGAHGMRSARSAPDAEKAFTFDFKPGETASLTVKTPVYPQPDPMDETEAKGMMDQMQQGMVMGLQEMGGEDNPFGLTGKETPMEAIGKIYKDTEMELLIEVVGAPVKTNAQFREADKNNRFAFLRVRPETMLQEKQPERILAQMMSGGETLQFLGAMTDVPNNRIETNRVVTIEFK